ncbi:MAG: alpha/beta fold hydrolase [Candidatus Thorarchaeota archaeon]|nr:alpha/beta fold hydrolase [Candidatus Thorarchaeota archaeon]
MGSMRVLPTEFTVADETIRGDFVLPNGDGPFPGICKFHGLPGGPDQVSGIATRLAQTGFAVLTFDFRGFRKSEGLFRLAGEIEDAKAAITHLLECSLTVDSWAGVYGASYGGAVAVCVAAQDPRIDTLCLRAPVYDTLWFAESPMIGPAVNHMFETGSSQIHGIEDPTTLHQILALMVDDARTYNPINEVSKISPRPILVVHGSDDSDIDLVGVKRLYGLAGDPKELIIVDGADHKLTNPAAYEMTVTTVIGWFMKQWNQSRSEVQ